jgi:hypothetical protein
MNEQERAQKLNGYLLPHMPTQLRFLFIVCVAIGITMLIAGFLGVHTRRMHQIYLVNFTFWTGLAQAGVVFAAVYRLAGAGWSDQFRRIGEMFAAFLPVSFVLLLFILVIHDQLYPWAGDASPKDHIWLTSEFFLLRVLFYFIVMTWLSVYYVATSVRPDIGLLKEYGAYGDVLRSRIPSMIIERYTRNWKGFDEEYRISNEKLKVLTPVFLITYGILYTFAGFDLLMTLEPEWYSTIYGWLFIISGFYSAVVALAVIGYFVRIRTSVGDLIDSSQFHDIGKLMLGFCMFTGGLIFSQFLTIWYGNIPKETAYIITRYYEEPWATVSTSVLLLAFFIPLVFLFSKKIKQTPEALFLLGVVILIALWLNRFVETVPSIWDEMYIPLGYAEAGVTLGFFVAVFSCWVWLARIVPLVPAKPE